MNRRTAGFLVWVAVLGVPAGVVGWDLADGNGISRFHDNQTVQGPLRLEAFRQWSQGRIPLWNPYKRAGAPLLADVSGALYPPNAVFAWAGPETRDRALDWVGALHHVLASAAMFWLLSSIGLRRAAALAGALLYSLNGFFVFGSARWIDMQNAMAWAPIVLACLVRSRSRFSWAALGAVAYALQICCGYPEFSVYTALATAGLGLALAAREPDRIARTLAATALIGFGGILLAAPQLLPTLQAVVEGARPGVVPYREFVSLSLAPLDFLGALAPPAAGDPAPQASLYLRYGATYFGVASIAFATAAWVRADAFSRYALALALVGLVLALGSNSPFGAIGYHVPGLNAFRSPMKHLFEFSLGLSMAFAIGIDRFLAAAPRSRGIVCAAASIGCVAAAWAATRGSATGLGWTGAVLGLFVAAAVWVPDRRPSAYAAIALTLLALVANRTVSLERLRAEPGLREIGAPAAATLRGDLSRRVLVVREPFTRNGLVGDLAVAWQIPALHGSGPYLWQPLADAVGINEIGTLRNARVLRPDDPTLDRLAVHTLLAPLSPAGRAPREQALRAQPATEISELDGFLRVDRAAPLPFARIADAVVCGPEAPQRRRRDAAVVRCDAPTPSSPGRVTELRIEPGEIGLRASIDGPDAGMLLVAQTDYPGWTARVDRREVPIVRTFGFLQGVWVPPGEHVVRLEYRPAVFRVGVGLAVFGTAGLLGVWRRGRGQSAA